MVVKFDKDYLKELYYEGKCLDKKHRYQPGIVEKYIRRVLTVTKSEEETIITICTLLDITNHYK